MIKPSFPSTSKPQSHNVTFLTIKTVVRKFNQNDGNTGSCAWTKQCLRKGGGGICVCYGVDSQTSDDNEFCHPAFSTDTES